MDGVGVGDAVGGMAVGGGGGGVGAGGFLEEPRQSRQGCSLGGRRLINNDQSMYLGNILIH